MKALLALAVVATALAAASAALASHTQPGYRFYTDNTSQLVGNSRPQAQPGYRFYTDNTSQLVGNRPLAQPGYRFYTDNTSQLVGNTRPLTAPSGASFRWSDAGIGASAAVGAILLLLGATLVLLRRRGRLAF